MIINRNWLVVYEFFRRTVFLGIWCGVGVELPISVLAELDGSYKSASYFRGEVRSREIWVLWLIKRQDHFFYSSFWPINFFIMVTESKLWYFSTPIRIYAMHAKKLMLWSCLTLSSSAVLMLLHYDNCFLTNILEDLRNFGSMHLTNFLRKSYAIIHFLSNWSHIYFATHAC